MNLQTDEFIEYSSSDAYQILRIEKDGKDFFNMSRENSRRVCYQDDQKNFLASFTKENVIRSLNNNGVFTLTYRIVFDGTPTYVHMKATRMGDKYDPSIVIGVSNIDEQIRREHERHRL